MKTAALGFCLSFILLSNASRAAGGSDRSANNSIESKNAHFKIVKILDYNVRGLPWDENPDPKRFKIIGNILHERRIHNDAPDVVLLQEMFMGDTRNIQKKAQYPYQAKGTPGKGFKFGSGLFMLSEHPIESRDQTSLGHCSKIECLADKSVQGATIRIPGLPDPLMVLTTHLQEGSEKEKYDKDRMRQTDKIHKFFTQKFGQGQYLALFGADFNFKPKHKSYYYFLEKMMGFFDAARFCLDYSSCEIELGGDTDSNDVWKTTNDRQFFYVPQNSPYTIEPVKFIRNFTEPQDDGKYLSDHWGLEVHYKISWPTN